MKGTARRWSLAGLAGLPIAFLAVGIWMERGGVGPSAGAPPPPRVEAADLDAGAVELGWPLMSVTLAPDDLHDPRTGILANPEERGREWERRGTLEYYDEGELQFASDVGVRVHGGSSRLTSPIQSFRLYFREEYGAEQFAPGVIFDASADPIDRLVAHNDLRTRFRRQARPERAESDRAYWHFVNPLAYDLATRIGAVAPQTKPARFFLNGAFLGVYVLTEYVTIPEFFESRFGYGQFSADEAAMTALSRWLDESGESLTMARAAEQVDLENLTRWFLSVLFAGTGDPFQGPGQFYDATRASGGWLWVNWDMDLSFRRAGVNMFERLRDQPGERRRGRRPSEPRARLMTHLLANDAEYRRFFMTRFEAMLNHQLTPEFLDERFAHYEQIALDYEVESVAYLEMLREFLDRRAGILWAQTAQQLGTGAPVQCIIEAPDGGVLIDGVHVEGAFAGRYFPNTMIEVALPETDGRPRGWFVNGERVASPDGILRLRLERDVAIEVVPS
ncbi:MAG: CotH kinase family protein [Vicinamibacterales bacterium]|nr:CotH kinase family protein [Vicinamibacterales bacterium]